MDIYDRIRFRIKPETTEKVQTQMQDILNNRIIHDDCLNVINQFDDESIDVCLTDPPYGIDFQSGRPSATTQQKPKILNDERPFTDWIKPLFPKMKDGGRLLCFYRWDVQNEFLNEIIEAGFAVKSQIIWDKGIHGMGDLKGEFAPQHESIIYATKGRYEFKDKRPTTLIRVNRVSADKLIHPNEKPILLLQKLLMSISSENELIFDPFGGSFSTWLAARSLNRNCISCELSDEYFKIGNNRIKNTINNKFF